MKSFPTYFVLSFLTLYISGVFGAPVLMHLGYQTQGEFIYEVYEYFCHQRIERTPFFFSQEGGVQFKTIYEFQLLGFIPTDNLSLPYPMSTKVFGHEYNGNSEVGYKAAVCIRDISIFLTMLIVGLVYNFVSRVRPFLNSIPNWVLILLVIPMSVDGILQTALELSPLADDYVGYINNIPKRVITGGMFGAGFGIFLFKKLKEVE